MFLFYSLEHTDITIDDEIWLDLLKSINHAIPPLHSSHIAGIGKGLKCISYHLSTHIQARFDILRYSKYEAGASLSNLAQLAKTLNPSGINCASVRTGKIDHILGSRDTRKNSLSLFRDCSLRDTSDARSLNILLFLAY